VKKRSLPLSEVYRLLEPGPVVMLTTILDGRPNIMTMSWHMMVEFEPPQISCIVSNRNYSFQNLRKTKECVINIPTVELIEETVRCGNISGRRIDKFKRLNLTPAKAKYVNAPLIEECYANLECRVVDTTLVNKYNLFILEVVKAWSNPSEKDPRTLHHRGKGVFMIAGETVRLLSRKK